jgi:hypothetical protein
MLIMMWFRDVVARARLAGGRRRQASMPQSGGLAGENRLLNLAMAPPQGAGQSHMHEQYGNLVAFGLDPFRQRFVFVHPYAIALPQGAAEQSDRSRREKRHKAFPGQAVSRPVLGRHCSGPKALI